MQDIKEMFYKHAKSELARLNDDFIPNNEKYNNLIKLCKKHTILSHFILNEDFMRYAINSNDSDSDFWIDFYGNPCDKNWHKTIIDKFEQDEKNIIQILDLTSLYYK